MNWPAFFSRKYLRAAFVTIIVPKRFVSICARNSDRGVSSTDERLPYPALLTTTSSEPNTSTVAITAFAAAASSVTSTAKSLTRSPYRSDRSASDPNVPSCRQHLIARSKARFNNCATQTARTTSDQPYLRHSSSYLALLKKFHAREIRAGGNEFVLLGGISRRRIRLSQLSVIKILPRNLSGS